jgi:DNA (cytosine-5)-methyltransferase 1
MLENLQDANCQPFSSAGERRGSEDDRYLWPEMRRVIDETRPDWVVGENVAGHVSLGLDEVLADLESLGYTALPFVIPAASVGARHLRDRCWVVAHSGRVNGERREDMRRPCDEQRTLHAYRQEAEHDLRGWLQAAWAANDPRICGGGNGDPYRMDRLRAIGNAVVPAHAFPIFAAIAETYNAT